MSSGDKENSISNAAELVTRIRQLNDRIDEYNLQLQHTGNTQDQYQLIEEIKTLHREIKRINSKLLPKAHRTGKH